jgi:hypothetical protein
VSIALLLLLPLLSQLSPCLQQPMVRVGGRCPPGLQHFRA